MTPHRTDGAEAARNPSPGRDRLPAHAPPGTPPPSRPSSSPRSCSPAARATTSRPTSAPPPPPPPPRRRQRPLIAQRARDGAVRGLPSGKPRRTTGCASTDTEAGEEAAPLARRTFDDAALGAMVIGVLAGRRAGDGRRPRRVDDRACRRRPTCTTGIGNVSAPFLTTVFLSTRRRGRRRALRRLLQADYLPARPRRRPG
ncbi:MAG: hypothetical protein U5R31_00270 [Acidimicrobiia bacterium]|nr:hypothetical protein [Acidimicrobiia bacterium]